MAAVGADIADAIVSLITGATLNQEVVVERQWVETQQLENMKEADPARVIVVPRVLEVMAFDLKPRIAMEWDIGVWIDKTVKTTLAACDPVAELMEEIVLLLATTRQFLIQGRTAQCIKIGPHPTYDSTQLLDIKVFRSVFVATYRLVQ